MYLNERRLKIDRIGSIFKLLEKLLKKGEMTEGFSYMMKQRGN